MSGDAETVGATRGELRLTITVGWALVMLRGVPPLLVPENAIVVQVVTPGEVNATAEKVKMRDSNVLRAALPPVAVRLTVPDEIVYVQDAVGLVICMGSKTVNPDGIIMVADPRRLVPVSVTVTVKVASWLAVTWGGAMPAVKVYVGAASAFRNAEDAVSNREISMLTVRAWRLFPCFMLISLWEFARIEYSVEY